ncbi:MAG: DUF2442 domain-containing protein [Bacteroidia bacterium]|nr:DUF2442 domain-containing protein [Bacteroidia bacterium]
MYPKIIDVKAIKNYNLLVTFDNNITKIYNCSNLLNLPQFYLLKDVMLFRSVKIDTGGYGILWNDDIDLSEYELWTNGIDHNIIKSCETV